MLKRKKLAALARKRRELELLQNPPKVIQLISINQITREKRNERIALVPRYQHRSSNDVITRPQIIASNTDRKEIPRYTGDRLLGIAVLHKSNLVPIFTAEEAIDAATMRR